MDEMYEIIQNPVLILVVSIATIVSGVAAVIYIREYYESGKRYQLEQTQRRQGKAQNRRDIGIQEGETYRYKMRPLLDEIKTIITKYSGDTDGIVQGFLYPYALHRAYQLVDTEPKYRHLKSKLPPLLTNHSEFPAEIVEEYRNATMMFYKDSDLQFTYPSAEEMANFMTWHWLIYQTNNISKEPHPDPQYQTMRLVHQKVLRHIRDTKSVVAVKVEQFHDEYKDVFMQLHKQIWGKNGLDMGPNAE